jgi:HD superfamily phosphodiesterase
MPTNARLIEAMIEHERGVPRRVGHFLKVYAYAQALGELEGLDPGARFILETAALVHDIGIKPSLAKYGSSAGRHQEREGPGLARSLLENLGYETEVIDRVCYLVGHHHSYAGIDGPDYQILVEADFLVNMHEEGLSPEAIRTARDKYFKTGAGRRFSLALYPAGD